MTLHEFLAEAEEESRAETSADAEAIPESAALLPGYEKADVREESEGDSGVVPETVPESAALLPGYERADVRKESVGDSGVVFESAPDSAVPLPGYGDGEAGEVVEPAMTTPVAVESSPSRPAQALTPQFPAPQSFVDGVVDIITAVRRSVDTHPDIAEAVGRLFQQNEQVATARAGYFPRVSSGIRSGYRSSTGRSEEAFNVTASQLLYDFGKVASTVEAATSGVDRERAAVLLAVDQLASDVARAVIEIQRYGELLKVADEQVEAIGELRELAAQRSAMGAATRSDEIQAQSRQEAARAARLQLKAQQDVWKRSLQSLMGLSTPVEVSADFPASLSQACEWAQEDFAATPAILMAEADRAEASATMRHARARMLPTLSLNAGYEHYLNRSDNDIAVNDDEDFTVTLSLTSELFQGGALRSQRRAAQHAMDTATAARDSAYLRLSRSFNEARDQSRTLRGRLDILGARYQSIVETQNLYRQQYLALGTRTLLDILNTEQEIHQSRFDRIHTLYDLRTLQVDCLYNVGGLRAAFGLSSESVRGVSLEQ